MRWVTFHWHIAQGVSSVEVHADKETAARFFRRNYGRFFQVREGFRVKPPCSYGYAHRKYMVCSLVSFKRRFGYDPATGAKCAKKAAPSREKAVRKARPVGRKGAKA